MPDLLLQADTARQTGLVILIVIVAVLVVGALVLGAYALVMRSINTTRDKESRELTERWRDPVLSAVEDRSLVPSVQAMVEEGDRVHFLGFVIEYARRVRGSEREILEELVKPFLAPISERARTDDTERRAWAVQILGTLGLPEHEEVVLAALDDPSPLVAMVAARALAREESPQYAPAVLARLDRFGRWDLHFLAAMLAAIGPSVSESLRAGLEDDSNAPRTRAVMAEALRLQGDFLAGDVAADVIQRTGNRDLLASALRLLAAVGRPEHAAIVRPLCTADDSVVRGQALRAMGPLGGDEDVAALVEAMDDPNPWPALYAARGVRDAGGREALVRLGSSRHPAAALARQVLSEESSL